MNSSLSVFDFNSNNIRFEKRDGRVLVCLTDMAKATGKKLSHWNALKSTTEFLTALEESIGITADQIIYSNESEGDNSQRGTWAIEEVAIKFAGWCSVSFEIWMVQQIKTLMTEGTVFLKELTPEELFLQNAQLFYEQQRRIKKVELSLQEQIILLQQTIQELQDQKELTEVHDMEIKANSVELDRFSNGQGYWYTILGYAKLQGLELNLSQASLLGRKATCLCKASGIKPSQVKDPRFGTVNTYPEHILVEVV